MFSSLLLIINDLEKAEECKNKLQADPSLAIYVAKTEEDALEKVEMFEPDLILLSLNYNEFDGFETCKKIRQLQCLTRPVIAMTSDSNEDSSKRIECFMAGADDYLDSNLSDEEFSIRIFAHIRRHIEELSDQTIHLPNNALVNTNIKRRINLQKPWALMLLNLSGIQSYNDCYGFIAGNQLLKAFIAIVRASMDKDDFFGYMGKDDFVLLTNPIKTEIIAGSICKTFDQVAPKFYAPYEADRGYTIISDMGKASRKAPLVSVNIGIGSSEHKKITDYKTALSIANNMKDLVKYQIGSGWLIDRPLISGEEDIQATGKKNYVLVVESDAALAYLLITTLEMQGYKVDATSNRAEAIKLINATTPDLVLIDAVLPGDDGWEICSYIKGKVELSRTKIIMATVLHDKEKAFSAGADLYIPKPYELMFLHKWISKLIQDSYY